jgi:hypothetical protein
MLLLSAVTTIALAAEPVFVAPFLPTDKAAEQVADEIANVILDELDRNKKIDGKSVDEMESVHNVSAADYMLGCLPDEFVGCAFVVGKSGDVKYSVAGRVTPLERDFEIDFRIIEIATAREVFQLTTQVAEGSEDLFAETVSRTLVGIIDGTIGKEVDVRTEEEADSGPNQEEVAAMDEFTQSEGGAETVEERVEIEVDETTLTEADIEYMMQMEGSKEWDRLGMKPKEYLVYFNSGMSLARWKALNRGRKGQVLVRGDLGVANGVYNGKYYGRIAKSNIDLSPIDLYAWQTLERGSGLDVTGSVSYGVLPELDVGIMGGVTTGSFELDVHSFVIGQFSAVPPAVSYATSTSYVGLQALYTPVVMPRVRPIVGGQVVHYRSGNLNFNFGGEVYPALPAANYTTLEVLLGGEVRMNEVFDVYAHVPIGGVLNFQNAPSVQQQDGGILSVTLDDMDVAKVTPPERFGRLGFSLNVGVQFRIPVVNEKVNALDMYE